MKKKEVVIVGAGPYGLSMAAYLLDAGVEPYVIGQPLAFWKRHMPKGMLLRSGIEASNIAAPQKQLSLAGYERATGTKFRAPIPIEDFIAYGEWFQTQVAPTLDTRSVRRVSQNGSGFDLTLEDGESVHARSVVLALGIGFFTHRPEQFAHIPTHLAPHASELSDPSQFKGNRVAVIGAGQSALEHAALLHEDKADVEILTRSAGPEYLVYPWRRKLFRTLTPGPLRPFSYRVFPPTDLGGFTTVRTIADPEKFKRASPEVQEALAREVTKPIGAYWLPSRLRGVRVRTGVSVERVERVQNGLKLALSDGSTTWVDRVVLGTGYRVDVGKYHILDEALRRNILRAPDGYPSLTMNLQTSIQGLYMVGVVAERALGPTLRFVTGTSNAGPRLTAAITGTRLSANCRGRSRSIGVPARHRLDVARPASPEKATMNITATRSDLGPNSPGAIVLGGNFIGLGLVRSLGARGIPTWVFDPARSQSIAQFSRYTKRFVRSKEDTHELLLREGRQNHLNGWVVFPGSDEHVEVLSTHHRSLSTIYRLTVPPLEVTRFALDKRLTYRKADELGIATPWTLVCDGPDDPLTNDLPYPVILKPAINHHFFPHTNLKALPVFTRDDFRRRYAQMSKYIPPAEILIQERIPGDGEHQFSFCAVCKDGQAYASLVARRRRQYPVDFGNASTFVETTSQSVIAADGRRFLEGIGFDGMAEVEFKFDPRDGRYKILDVNPRPWGWHTLGKAAGIDFPYLLWQQKMGLDVSPIHSQDSASWLREITDLIAIAKSPHRKAEIKRLLRAIGSGTLTSATFDLFDPLPFFAEFGLWATRGFLRQRKTKAFLGA